MTLVNNNAYAPLLGSLGVDVMINPRDITVSSILQHVRRGRINRPTLRDGEAEVFEAGARDLPRWSARAWSRPACRMA